MKVFIKEFKVEIIVFGIAILGALIWFDPLGIRSGTLALLESLIMGVGGFIPDFEKKVIGFFSSLTVSEVVGFFILVIASVFVIARTRSRYLVSDFYLSRNCPRCGDKLIRIRRKWYDRVLSVVLFVPFHRYRCVYRDCGWKGLRKPGRHHHQWDPQEEELLRDQLSA
jgi:choline-glycine betaine transporter